MAKKQKSCLYVKEPLSNVRKSYILKFSARCIILVLCVLILFFDPEQLDILKGLNFFKKFSLLHLLWGVWVFDMLCQLLPIRKKIALGSQKIFKERFRPIKEKINSHALKEYVISTTRAAYKVLVLWSLLITALGILHYCGILSDSMLFIVSVVFYLCDLICVLFWCPFRLILKNRCCTTCRIFNWDHLMMFTPMIFVGGFFSISLLLMALIVWLVWELCFGAHPERFWENSNEALKCSSCTDKLCIQYCQKLRKNQP